MLYEVITQTMLQTIELPELEDLILDIQVHTYKRYLDGRGNLSPDDLVEVSLSRNNFV